MQWTEHNNRKQLFSTELTLSEYVSVAVWLIIENIHYQNYISLTSKNGYSQTGSNINVTGNMTWSGASTFTLLYFQNGPHIFIISIKWTWNHVQVVNLYNEMNGKYLLFPTIRTYAFLNKIIPHFSRHYYDTFVLFNLLAR